MTARAIPAIALLLGSLWRPGLTDCAAAAPTVSPPPGGPCHVETIDAVVLGGQITAIDDKTLVLRVGNKTQNIPRDQIIDVSLDRADRAADRPAQGVLTTHRGDVMSVSALRLDKGQFTFTNDLLGRTQIAMSDVATVFLPGPAESARDVRRRCDRKQLAATSQDTLVVVKEGKLLSIRGVLESIGAVQGSSETKVSFRWQETDRTISISSVRAIVLAKTPVKTVTAGGTLTGRGGTRVEFTSLMLTGQTFRIHTPAAGAKTVARKAVAAIRFNTPSAVDLSSIAPSHVREYGFFDRTFPHRVDASVSGGPLRLGGREYRTGLGLHSFCELTYALEGRYSRLVTAAGIDDAVRPAGNAELSIYGDGKLLGRPTHLTGKDSPTTLRVDLAGVKTLTVRVGFGADGLDIADHVDLGAARLIKAGK